jgi:hypothetical protein
MIPLYNTSGKYDLPKLLELQETPLNLAPNAKVILQPKFDGCQAIYIPVKDQGKIRYIPVTRKGNEITRLVSHANELSAEIPQGNAETTPVIFTEYEPVPWSDNNKAKLAGNLYNNEPLEFGSRVVAFDAIDASSFYSGKMRATETKPRLVYLDSLKPQLKGIEVSPWKETTYKEALEECKSSRIETHEGTRCKVLDILCEGGVIRHGMKGQKEKPTVDKDIAILELVTSPKGQLGWIGVDTKDPTPTGLMLVFGGITAGVHAKHLNEVVEVKLLTVSGLKGAGNPTFIRSRANEKEADCAALRATLQPSISAMIKQAKLSKGVGIDR